MVFSHRILASVEVELAAAEAYDEKRDFIESFSYLERSHVLGQAAIVFTPR